MLVSTLADLPPAIAESVVRGVEAGAADVLVPVSSGIWRQTATSDANDADQPFRLIAFDEQDEWEGTIIRVSQRALQEGERVGRELDAIAERRHGYPCMVVSDNGTELTSNAMLKWQQDRDVEWHYIAQANPCRTASWKALTAGYEMNASTSICLPATGIRHARQIIEDWRIDYNLNRPHTSLDGLTPNEFATRSRVDHNVNRANL